MKVPEPLAKSSNVTRKCLAELNPQSTTLDTIDSPAASCNSPHTPEIRAVVVVSLNTHVSHCRGVVVGGNCSPQVIPDSDQLEELDDENEEEQELKELEQLDEQDEQLDSLLELKDEEHELKEELELEKLELELEKEKEELDEEWEQMTRLTLTLSMRNSFWIEML